MYAIKEQGRVLELMHKVGDDPLVELTVFRPKRMTFRCAWLGSRVICLLELARLCGCTRWGRRRCYGSARTTRVVSYPLIYLLTRVL